MDPVIWIEVLSRHRHVLSRARCAGRVVRIGRAYSNDVVVDDPYVAPEHVHILHDGDGGLVVEDLGSHNGLFAEHGQERVARLVLGGEAVFRIGHTLLRVRTADHPVGAERVAAAQRRLWPGVVAAGVAVPAIAAALIWMADYTEARVVDYVVPLVGVAVVVALWSALWAVVSRIFAGQARFAANLLAGLIAALAVEAWYALSDVGAFAFSWNALATYRYVGFWCILALAAYVHLRQINPERGLVKAAVVAALLAFTVAVQILVQLDPSSGLQESYVRLLMPPAFRLSPVAGEASFFTAVEKLQHQLDQDRTEAP